MVLNGAPIGYLSWNHWNRSSCVEIVYNCIISKYKGNGFGKIQLEEAIGRIKEYVDLEKIVVSTMNFFNQLKRIMRVLH